MCKVTTDLGGTIRRLRRSRGMEQSDLAENSGITQSHLSKIENGKANPSLKKLRIIADALGVDEQVFFNGNYDVVSLNGESAKTFKHLDEELRHFITKEESAPFLEFARDIHKIGFNQEELEALKLIFISRRQNNV